MRDALGGVVNIQFILVFIVIVSGYLAFSVNYTKAFRVKNKIITTIEQYGGVDSEEAKASIKSYMDQIGYGGINQQFADKVICTNKICPENSSYCVCQVTSGATTTSETSSVKARYYYQVFTFINVDIPVINRILPILGGLFEVKGETKLITAN